MVEILTWVSLITGGILILMLLLSLIGGLDLDIDIGGGDVDVDSGGLGFVKGFLTFISVTTWIIKALLIGGKHPGLATVIGILCGMVALFVVSYVFKLMLKNESNVNWSMNDALYQKGKVYLKIPATEGEGIVQVTIKGAKRELKAKSFNKKEIITGAQIKIVDVEENYVLVLQEEIE